MQGFCMEKHDMVSGSCIFGWEWGGEVRGHWTTYLLAEKIPGAV